MEYAKPEKEYLWIINLLNSQYIRGGFFTRQRCGCIKDFEMELGVSENNKDFRKWIKFLIKENILEFYEDDSSTKRIKYVVNYAKLENLLYENPLYNPTRKIFEKKAVLGLSK